MPSLNLDFSNIDKREPLPEGTYQVSVTKVEQSTAKTSGNALLKVAFAVMDEGFEKRKLFTNLVLQDNCMWKVAEFLGAVGLPCDAMVDIDTDELIGLTCSVKVAQREYQGEIQNEIKKFL